jgi:hypothetical protein
MMSQYCLAMPWRSLTATSARLCMLMHGGRVSGGIRLGYPMSRAHPTADSFTRQIHRLQQLQRNAINRNNLLSRYFILSLEHFLRKDLLRFEFGSTRLKPRNI